MAWKRRRSRGPLLLLLLGMLCAASAAAPWMLPRLRELRQSWWRAQRTPDGQRFASTTNSKRIAALPADDSEPIVLSETWSNPPVRIRPRAARAVATLGDVAPRDLTIPEPVAANVGGTSAAAESLVAADDYVVVDEPLVVQEAAGPNLESPNAPTLTSSSPAESCPAPPTVVDAPPRVMVDGENDRLAMLLPPYVEGLRLSRRSTLDDGFDDGAMPHPTSIMPLAPAATHETSETPSAGLIASPANPAGPAPMLRQRPEALLNQLDQLADMPAAAAWAAEVRQQINVLCEPAAESITPLDDGAQAAIAALRRLSLDGLHDAATVVEPATQSAWLRTSRALERRLSLWQLLADPVAASLAAAPPQETPEQMAATLQLISTTLAAHPQGAAWRAYLRLDDLAGLTSVGAQDQTAARRTAARSVLARCESASLDATQRQFLARAPIDDLPRELKIWAGGPVPLETLAGLIERYELHGEERDADAIAELRLRMNWSNNDALQRLADELNRNYRNANVRIAFAEGLLKRLVPTNHSVNQRIHDTIAGAEVQGRSTTNSQVALKLTPDPAAWRFRLEARGDVRSQTMSNTWPARVRNNSRMRYEASKEIVIDPAGLHIRPAKASAAGRTDLVGVDSNWEPVPLLGSLVESAARQKHRESKPAALAQVKAKVATQARQRMDRETDPKLKALEEKIRAAVMAPLAGFDLHAEPVDMSTTAERAVVRMRMADQQQLAAHTPRPTAPSDSLISIQIHESALNNAMQGLGLDGRRLTVSELHGLLAAKFSRQAAAPPADMPKKAIVEFAKHDAVRLACRADRVELILKIVELRKGRDSIRNIEVHAFYKPVMEGLEVKLVRDGGVQFAGAHLRTGPRLVLHSVFSHILRKDQETSVASARLDADPRLSGLMVTQMVVDDGWIAASIGPATPQRTAWRTRMGVAAAPSATRQR